MMITIDTRLKTLAKMQNMNVSGAVNRYLKTKLMKESDKEITKLMTEIEKIDQKIQKMTEKKVEINEKIEQKMIEIMENQQKNEQKRANSEDFAKALKNARYLGE